MKFVFFILIANLCNIYNRIQYLKNVWTKYTVADIHVTMAEVVVWPKRLASMSKAVQKVCVVQDWDNV